jgi:hypothetical protein
VPEPESLLLNFIKSFKDENHPSSITKNKKEKDINSIINSQWVICYSRMNIERILALHSDKPGLSVSVLIL